MDEKKKELLKKLHVLAERGATEGEKRAARQQLDKLLQKYNIDEADLSDDVLELHWYTCKDPAEKKIFAQVCYKIARDRPLYKKNYGKGQRTQKGIECTKAEALQIEIEFDFYKMLWHEEVEFFLQAFIQKHKIFDLSPGHKTDDSISIKDAVRMAHMAAAMQDRTLHKMIEN